VSGHPVKVARKCAHTECIEQTRARLGFCPTHYLVAYACSFDAACPHRCAAHSRTKLCQEHAWYGYKLRREKHYDWLDDKGEE